MFLEYVQDLYSTPYHLDSIDEGKVSDLIGKITVKVNGKNKVIEVRGKVQDDKFRKQILDAAKKYANKTYKFLIDTQILNDPETTKQNFKDLVDTHKTIKKNITTLAKTPPKEIGKKLEEIIDVNGSKYNMKLQMAQHQNMMNIQVQQAQHQNMIAMHNHQNMMMQHQNMMNMGMNAHMSAMGM